MIISLIPFQFDFATKESVTQMNNRNDNTTNDAKLATVVAQRWVISREAGNVTISVTEVVGLIRNG